MADPSSSSEADELTKMLIEMESLKLIASNQQKKIAQLEKTRNLTKTATSASSLSKCPASLPNIKVVPIAPYGARPEGRTSTKVKGFLYNVRSVAGPHSMDDTQTLALAECRLQEKAAAWIIRLESTALKPVTFAEFESAMLKEFVPSDERARAKTRLLTLKINRNTRIEQHITLFQSLLDVANAPLDKRTSSSLCLYQRTTRTT